MKRRISPVLILIGCLTIVMAAMFLPSIIAHVPLAYGTDLKPEQLFFTEELYQRMDAFFQHGTLPFYSWDMFLGSDFYTALSFYGNADLYNLIGYLLRSMNFFDRTMVLEIMKLYAAGLGMYALLKEMKFSDRVRIIGALCYAFSGWAVFFSGQLMFLSVYSFIPLYFWGMERYLQKNRYGIFLLSVPLIIFTNWYFFYTISALSPLWFLYRYAVLHGSLRGSLKPILKLIAIDAAGIMLAGIYLLPTLVYMEGNDRAFAVRDFLVFSDWKVYIHLLISAFVPNHLYIYGNNVLDASAHYTREICLYAGGATALLSINALFLKDRQYAKPTRIMFLTLCVICAVPYLDSAVHGFGDPSFRWLFVFVIFNIINACTALEHREELDSRRVLLISGIEALLCAIAVPAAALASGKPVSDYSHQWMVFLVSAAVIAAYGALISRKERQLIKLLLCCTTAELACWQLYFFSGQVNTEDASHSYLFQQRATHVLQDSPGQLNAYLNSLDADNFSEYFRVYIPEKTICWDYSYNMPIAYQLNGLMTYCSTYEPSFNFMKKLVPAVKQYESEFLFDINDGSLVTFLNTKYAVVTSESDLPKGDWKLINDNFRDGLQVYENQNYRPLGTSYSKAVSESEYQSNPDTGLFVQAVIAKDDQIEKISTEVSDAKTALENITYGGNHLYGTYTSDQDGYMVLTIPYNQGWKLTVDGKEVSYDDISGGFIGFAVSAGSHEVQMYFVPQGFKAGALLSCGGALLAAAIMILERKKHLNI